ncbi:hypothetical protein JTB14_011987 [Gonioctena quinquepunctata]|nr:hypothetical protein JTB14_011987 [Gonioctena quinquepunctata]
MFLHFFMFSTTNNVKSNVSSRHAIRENSKTETEGIEDFNTNNIFVAPPCNYTSSCNTPKIGVKNTGKDSKVGQVPATPLYRWTPKMYPVCNIIYEMLSKMLSRERNTLKIEFLRETHDGAEDYLD